MTRIPFCFFSSWRQETLQLLLASSGAETTFSTYVQISIKANNETLEESRVARLFSTESIHAHIRRLTWTDFPELVYYCHAHKRGLDKEKYRFFYHGRQVVFGCSYFAWVWSWILTVWNCMLFSVKFQAIIIHSRALKLYTVVASSHLMNDLTPKANWVPPSLGFALLLIDSLKLR